MDSEIRHALKSVIYTLAFCLKASGLVILATLGWLVPYRLLIDYGFGSRILDVIAITGYVLIIAPFKFYQAYRILTYDAEKEMEKETI